MGNIDALRDWGHAKDYVRMQDDASAGGGASYVIATGKQYSRENLIWSQCPGIEIEFRGAGIGEIGVVIIYLEIRPLRSQWDKKL